MPLPSSRSLLPALALLAALAAAAAPQPPVATRAGPPGPPAPPAAPGVPRALEEFCFGATGQQCGDKPGQTAFCAQLPGCGSGACLVSGGSWEHDTCCHAHPDGAGCHGAVASGKEVFCVAEWAKARKRTTAVLASVPSLASAGLSALGAGCGNLRLPAAGGWIRQVDFTKPNATGQVVFADYCASTGSLVHPEDAQYCCSRLSRRLLPLTLTLNGVTVATLRANLTPSASPVLNAVLGESTSIPLRLPNPFADDREFNVVLKKHAVEFDSPGVGTTIVDEGSWDMALCTDVPQTAAAFARAELQAAAEDAIKLMWAADLDGSVIARMLKEKFGLDEYAAAAKLRGASPASVTAGILLAALKGGYGLDLQAGVRVLKDGLQLPVEEIARAAKVAFNPMPIEVATLLKDTYGYRVEEIASAMKAGFDAALHTVATLLHGFGYTAGELFFALKSAFGSADAVLLAELKAQRFDQRAIAQVLVSPLGLTADQAGPALKAAGFGAREVLDALVNQFGLGSDVMAAKLKACGFGQREITAAFKDGFGSTAEAMAAALQGAGFSARETADALFNFYDSRQQAIVDRLVAAGYALGDVRAVIRDIWANPAEEDVHKAIGLALHAAGSGALDVVRKLQAAFNIDASRAARVLHALGVSFADAQGVLVTAFGLALVDAVAVLQAAFR